MSIDVNVQNDLVIVTESSEDIVVNVSNAAGPAGANGVGVPVGGATGQVLKKFTNTDYDTYWAADASGLTSVGLSMPTAFTVSNTPLTTNGTLAVTGAGTAAQYIRGDGQLATFPSSASGGSSVNYYLNGSVNASVAGYKQLSNTATIGGGTDFTLVGNGLIAQFLTDVGNPNRIEIPGGAWNFEMFFQVSSSGGNQKFYVELLKYNGTTFTSIASSSAVPEEITGGTAIDLYLTSLAVPTTALLITDRLAIRVYIVDNAAGRTITLHTEDNTLCEIVTTFAGGISALNGLSANTQYLATGTSGTDFAISSLTDTHTFNLPTASGTNRGALSSADWSTFSGKISGTGTTGQVAYWNGTNSQTGSNNLFWDAANARLGIGTNAPVYGLHLANKTAYIRPTNNSDDALFISNQGFVQFRGVDDSVNSRFRGVPGSFQFTDASFNLKSIISTNNGFTYFNNGGGNVSIGGTTDGGQRLQVYGDAFIKGSGATSATNALLVQNSAGTELLKVRNDGLVLISSQGNGTARIFGYGTTNTDIGSSLLVNGSGSYEIRHAGTGVLQINKNITNDNKIRIGNTYSDAQTSGDVPFVEIYENTFNPTSGTATLSLLKILATINQTGGANGITRGLYINSTLTSAADWRAIEISAGVSVLAPSSTASATLRIPSGTAPTSPVNGDIWFDGTNLFMRIGGVTKTFTLI